MTAFGTRSATVRFTIPKYDWIKSLITSVSCCSRSVIWPEAFKMFGGASMAANLFLFFEEKNPPKKEPVLSSSETGGAEVAA
ncbi:hypothetical protein OGAPHI_002780 [Ogataea philodendri]|uniref:Uncharacterized protein n=1 Tax=Ogataea philodendri TaxID=1378263 RepID=A0A9P8T6P5_9ASCO|nr:uncharacterized protein OGAPHI_002780 [Ogataea philodendri]KAH3667131.1 hypothetical protein OGAPHI_002780 [Ogataea philodendri]